MKYRKKPSLPIEAIQWTGDNIKEVEEFCPKASQTFRHINLAITNPGKIAIETPEGVITSNVGDYIIKVADDKFYPCEAKKFEESYERIEE